MIQKISDKFFIDVIFNQKGKYIIEFYAKTRDSKLYEYIYEYRITCNKPLIFPIQFPKNKPQQTEIIEPKNFVLTKGKKTKFRTKCF